MTLRAQLLALQALIVCLVTVAAGLAAGAFQERAIRDSYRDRMQAVAQSIASLPTIRDAFDDADPSRVIQPVAEVIREASDLAYVVVADAHGLRFSHPNAALIGKKVSTDPSIPLSGEIYVGTQTGTLGTTWRVKVPIRADGGTVIGTVSVGILESELRDAFVGHLAWLIGAMIAAALLGLLGAAWATSVIRRRIHRLEPEQITALVRSHETTMHRLSEGVIVVGPEGAISLVNDAAADLLGRPAEELTGSRAAETLPGELVQVLEEGEASGRPVILGPRVVVARSTGATVDGAPVEATLLLRDHTELHDVVRRVDAADAIIAFRERSGIPKGLSAETLERVTTALAAREDSSASEIADALGISRVSARRYLEYLASTGRASRTLDYTTKGRPGSRYRLLDAAPVR